MRFLVAFSRAIDADSVRTRLAVAALLLVAMLAALLVAYRQFMQPHPGPLRLVTASIGMSIEPFDPRAAAQGDNQANGHGGGSQGLFFAITEQGNGGALSLVRALSQGNAVEVWEILRESDDARRAVSFHAKFVYQAPGYAPECVVKEWGVSYRSVSPPTRGLAVQYVSVSRGERDATAASAVVEIVPQEAFNPAVPDKVFAPVARWSDGGRGVERLAPGKSARVLFLLRMAARAPAAVAGADRELPASELRAYARVSIGGKDFLIESSNALYAVWVSEDRIVSVDTGIEDPVENLRSLAYQARGAMTQRGAAQAILAGAAEPPAAARAAPAPIEEAITGAAAAARYVVQLGAFRQEAHARQLAMRLNAAGFRCAVTRIAAPDGTALFRVRVTPALPRRDAELLSAKLGQEIPALQPIVMREDR